MTEIRLPQFGMGMTDGTIIAWHKAEGETIAKGELLCSIEAAKTTVDYESPVSGTIAKILVPLDRNVPVNTPIVEIDEKGTAAGAIAPIAEEADVPSAQPGAPGDVRATPLAKRAAEQAGVDLATVEGSGPNGRIRRDDVTGVGAGSGAGAGSTTPTAPAPSVQIEPRARKAARDLGVDLAAVAGSGPNGRIVVEDVIAFAEAKKAPAAAVAPPAPEAPPAGDAGFVEIKHSMMRKTIARRLTESKQTVPHFYLKASCRIDALLAARKTINVEGQEKVSVNDLVIRAIAMALLDVPDANVTWDEKVMRQYNHVDIAVAVATPRGLVTPVVRNVEAKTIRQIAAEVKELAGRGREGKLKPEEYQGGTTSVSNLGMYGVEEFSAIINPPQSTIFAIGAGEERVVPVEGKPGIATMMTVTMSVDHRAVDGAVGAQLLAAFKAIIENPVRILA
ncbi:MAG: 2-oxo acid dehydrogenase subunit E2 [Novosphingobium sp.]|nr:2-oxo acid dehydrogenase subunit E2 [Novosphingobium sp.]